MVENKNVRITSGISADRFVGKSRTQTIRFTIRVDQLTTTMTTNILNFKLHKERTIN